MYSVIVDCEEQRVTVNYDVIDGFGYGGFGQDEFGDPEKTYPKTLDSLTEV